VEDIKILLVEDDEAILGNDGQGQETWRLQDALKNIL